MKYIETVIGDIDDELEGAEHYLECAVKHPEWSERYKRMALAELDHALINHDIVVDFISKYRSEKGEPPKEMLAIWDYEHEKYIDYANELKYKLSNIK